MPLTIARQAGSAAGHPAIGELIRPLVAFVSGMAFDPVPMDAVRAIMDQRIQPLP